MAALKNAVQPPAAELVAAFVALGGDTADIRKGLGDLLRLRPAAKQQIERPFDAQALGLAEVVTAGAERGAAVKVSCPLGSPWVGGGGVAVLPCRGGIDLVQRRKRYGHTAPWLQFSSPVYGAFRGAV